MYRDDLAAARVQTAALARSLMERSASLVTLARYRAALRVEIGRLRHAVVWYENGERYGFNHFRTRDDLTPARAEAPPLPSWPELERVVDTLDAGALDERLRLLTDALGRGDPRVVALEADVASLRFEAEMLRALVDTYAAKHPEHPPPPEFDGASWAIGTTVAVLSTLWAVLGLMFAG